MVTIRVQGGTPEQGVSLCASCSWGLVRKGYRAAEEEVFCRMIEPNVQVPYTVRDCSAYSDRRIPSLYFMEKTAWVLLTMKAGRTIGFVTSDEFRTIYEGEDAGIVPTPSGETEPGA